MGMTTAPSSVEQKSSKNTYPPCLGAFTPFTYSPLPPQGLDFLLFHFSNPLFPRTIMTPKTMQKVVNSRKQALDYFKESNYEDCRINAFYHSELERTGGLSWKPDLIFIDLDLQDFKSVKALRVALFRTLKNIKDNFDDNVNPTILHSGGGYHVIQPVECPALEEIKEFNEYQKPSELFLRFCKDFLSNGKADSGHNPSFRSCLLRVPGTKNKRRNNKKVWIVQKWNGYRPHVPKSLIIEFQGYLIKKKLKKRLEDEKALKSRQQNNNYDARSYYEWIERLLDTAIGDCRKRAIDLVIAPYLIEIKKQSHAESFHEIRGWLDRCHKVNPLDGGGVDYNCRIKVALKNSERKQIPPMRREKFMMEHLNKNNFTIK